MMKNNGKAPVQSKRKAFVLVMVVVVAVSLCVWLFVMPRIEEKRLEDRTVALLDSIEQGIGEIPMDSTITARTVDYYDTPDDGGDVITLFWENPDASTDSEAATPAVSDQPESTEVITGIGVLTIEKIDLKMPVSDGISEAQLKVSAGWVPQTAPVGETGNAVIAGHRNYAYGSHFNRLGEMEIGDTIAYTSKDGESMVFVVSEILEVLPGDQTAFVQPEDQQMLTLYTCTPIRTASHRLLVRALLVQ